MDRETLSTSLTQHFRKKRRKLKLKNFFLDAWEENAHEKLEPASVTKIMTLLLVMEAVDAGQLSMDDLVTVSAYAAGMGGSQVYLEEGEQMPVSKKKTKAEAEKFFLGCMKTYNFCP